MALDNIAPDGRRFALEVEPMDDRFHGATRWRAAGLGVLVVAAALMETFGPVRAPTLSAGPRPPRDPINQPAIQPD